MVTGTEITDIDVESVAAQLGIEVSEEETQEILERYDEELENDPNSNWSLVVENLIYSVKN